MSNQQTLPDERKSLVVLFKTKALKNYGCAKMLQHLLNRSEQCNCKIEITELKTFRMTRRQAEEFYGEHKGKDFFNKLVAFMTSNKIVAIRVEYDGNDKDFIKRFRRDVIGSTNPNKAEPGTMRYCFGDGEAFELGVPSNAVHCSDSEESADREGKIVFDD